MSFTRNLQAVILLVLSVAAPVVAFAVTPTGPAAPTAAAADRAVVEGKIAQVDQSKKLIVVNGRTFQFDPKAMTFSDDRAKRGKGGVQSLRVGDKVSMSTMASTGLSRVTILVVKD